MDHFLKFSPGQMEFSGFLVRLAQAAMEQKETRVSELCEELGVSRVTLSV